MNQRAKREAYEKHERGNRALLSGNFKKARSYYEAAACILREINDEDKLAATLCNLTRVYAKLDDPKWQRTGEESLRLCAKSQNPLVQTLTYINLADAYFAHSQHVAASKSLVNACSIASEEKLTEEFEGAVKNALSYAADLYEEEQYEEAAVYCRALIAHAEESKNDQLVAEATASLADVVRATGHFEESLNLYEKAYSLIGEKVPFYTEWEMGIREFLQDLRKRYLEVQSVERQIVECKKIGLPQQRGAGFEEMVRKLLAIAGFETAQHENIHVGSQDIEADIIVKMPNVPLIGDVVVECKLWQRPVNRDAVLKLAFLKANSSYGNFLVVHDGETTKGARELASEKGIGLIGFSELADEIVNILKNEVERLAFNIQIRDLVKKGPFEPAACAATVHIYSGEDILAAIADSHRESLAYDKIRSIPEEKWQSLRGADGRADRAIQELLTDTKIQCTSHWMESFISLLAGCKTNLKGPPTATVFRLILAAAEASRSRIP